MGAQLLTLAEHAGARAAAHSSSQLHHWANVSSRPRRFVLLASLRCSLQLSNSRVVRVVGGLCRVPLIAGHTGARGAHIHTARMLVIVRPIGRATRLTALAHRLPSPSPSPRSGAVAMLVHKGRLRPLRLNSLLLFLFSFFSLQQACQSQELCFGFFLFPPLCLCLSKGLVLSSLPSTTNH